MVLKLRNFADVNSQHWLSHQNRCYLRHAPASLGSSATLFAITRFSPLHLVKGTICAGCKDRLAVRGL